MPQAEELEEAEIGEVAQAEVEAGRFDFEFPKRGIYRESGSHFARPATQSAAYYNSPVGRMSKNDCRKVKVVMSR